MRGSGVAARPRRVYPVGARRVLAVVGRGRWNLDVPGPEQIEAYRRMTSQERWKLTPALMKEAWRALLALEPEERERQLEAIRRQHRLSNERIAAALK